MVVPNKNTKIVRQKHFLPTTKEFLRAIDAPRRGAYPYTPCIGECPRGRNTLSVITIDLGRKRGTRGMLNFGRK